MCRGQLIPDIVNGNAWRDHLAEISREFGARAATLLNDDGYDRLS